MGLILAVTHYFCYGLSKIFHSAYRSHAFTDTGLKAGTNAARRLTAPLLPSLTQSLRGFLPACNWSEHVLQ